MLDPLIAYGLRTAQLGGHLTELTPEEGEAKHRRLREAKRVWDPRNLLRYDKNIAPADET
ncbi:BBE domain-containing protein [Streptomyces roseirectus]|uniref:BBE domain-containing protein n=1 Tax=Streptomyces roseirectus TaxID=2768066 RepID=UPI001FE7B264|nr:BBE domain-containing protein [Streptomyces roseirectus]